MYKIRTIKHDFFLKKKICMLNDTCIRNMIINKRVRYRCIFFLFSGDEKKKERKKLAYLK